MTSINLIPPALVFARQRRARLRLWGIATACGLFLVALPIAVDQVQAARADALREELGALIGEEAILRDRLSVIDEESKHLRNQTERAKALRAKRAWSNMLSLLGACLPAEAWYTSIATDPEAPVGGRTVIRSTPETTTPGQPAKPAPKTITIDAPRRLVLTGYALENEHVYALMGNLGATRVFSGIELVESVRDANREVPAMRFQLRCEW